MKDDLVKTHGAALYSSFFFFVSGASLDIKRARKNCQMGRGQTAVGRFFFKIQFQHAGNMLVHMIHQMYCLCLDFTFKAEKSIH